MIVYTSNIVYNEDSTTMHVDNKTVLELAFRYQLITDQSVL